jgi:hypothetical protein
MKHVKLGTSIETKLPFEMDIERLVETRLLIQANSGGGKSYCIRKLLEATHGKVQHIVLDSEGEFSTLRENKEYILAGKNGDIPADPKTAELLARKVLELNVSLIVDLYELKAHDRQLFVKNFTDALVNSPKNLWHPALIVIDEAHVYAPEKGNALAMPAVVDLTTRGRKRGFSVVLATQRLSKLHKDVAAECINKLIGRTGLDIDMKRAGDELGFSGRDRVLTLRDLEAGEFYAFGPAFSKYVTKVKIDAVASVHPKAGQRFKTYTQAPTDKVKQILLKLSDIPKQAEEELHDKRSMTLKIKELENKLKAKPTVVQPSPPVVGKNEIEKIKKDLTAQFEKKYNEEIKKFKKEVAALSSSLPEFKIHTTSPVLPVKAIVYESKPAERSVPQRAKSVPTQVDLSDIKIGRCERAILSFLCMREGKSFSKVQIGALTGYSHTSGGFSNAISKLIQLNYINRLGSSVCINSSSADEIKEILGNDFQSNSVESLEQWLTKLGKCSREIYQVLMQDPSKSWTKTDLGEETNYSHTSGGFSNALSQLNTLGLTQKNHDGTVCINSEIIHL